MSSFVGALAPDLVLAGFESYPDAAEEALGELVGSGFTSEHLLEGLGTRWHITENYFRLYACCNPIHGALDCLQTILAKLRPSAQDIERVDIATYRFASVMRNPDPPNFFASKYSLPHAAAVMIARGSAGHSAIDDSALTDPTIASLRHRVFMTEDAAMSAVAPRLRPARVTVTLKDGRQETASRESHRGDFNEPFEESELREKFRELAGFVLTPGGAIELERTLERCEDWESLAELREALRRGCREVC
jgi:2-methylcitrate dehydratase PrpD